MLAHHHLVFLQVMFYTIATVENFHFLLHLCNTIYSWGRSDPNNVAVIMTLVDERVCPNPLTKHLFCP